MNKFPKDKNGKEFKLGDIFQEGYIGEKIWNNQASLWQPPLGVFMGVQVEYPVKDGWVIRDYAPGIEINLKTGEIGDIYVSRHDGEFAGDWSNTLIVGTITGDKEACAQFFGENWEKTAENIESLKESFKKIGDEAAKAKEAMLKMCEAMMKKVEEMTPEEAAKLVEECGLVCNED